MNNLYQERRALKRTVYKIMFIFLLTGTLFGIQLAKAQESIEATVNFTPDVLNLVSKGRWITAYIELPEEYNVTDIVLATVLINNTVQVDPEAPSVTGDYDNDGFEDLMVNFNRTQLVEYILSGGISYGNVVLTISGELSDGTPFEGSVTIKVSSLAGDVNCDGIVDIYDVVAAAVSYDSKEGEPNWNPNANYAPPLNEIDMFDIVTITYNYGKTHP